MPHWKTAQHVLLEWCNALIKKKKKKNKEKRWISTDLCFNSTLVVIQTTKPWTFNKSKSQCFFEKKKKKKPLSWVLSTEDYIPLCQKTKIPQMHLNVFPPALHSSGMTHTGTVWQVWSCKLHLCLLHPWRNRTREPGTIRYSSLAGWSRRPCDK